MKAKGFTLLELLITSVLITLVVTAAYSAFYTGKSGYGLIEKRSEQNQAARAVMERISRDVRNCLRYAPKNCGFRGAKDSLAFFLTRENHEAQETTRVFSRVAYKYAGGNLSVCYRDRRLSLENDAGMKYDLFTEGLSSCVFSYGQLNADLKRLEWMDAWKQDDTLPLAVRITIVFAATGETFTDEIFLARQS